MLFCSQAFVAFFAIVLLVYWALPGERLRVGFLLAASFFFYASWNRWLALVVGLTSLLDYAIGLGMEASRSPRIRKALLGSSLAVNIGLLFYFKYANFFLHSFGELLRSAGIESSLPTLSVILPIGISFYTFEAINYTVDVYRRAVPAERDPSRFLLFITFFPHLVAGPIVRARDFLPQVRRTRHWSWSRAQVGVLLFLIGLFKKVAIADRMALVADPIFAHPEGYRSLAVWSAVIAYAVQIYCDFSGYTDMAIGCAHLLGYKLAPNFDRPYLAANISDFWRRWHISLSSWLRDYLFIPLGGSRGTAWRTRRNLFITMTLGGLWHGASWTFVAWGAVHGILLIGHRAAREAIARRPELDRNLRTGPGTMLRVAATFLCVSLGWVFFRSSTFGAAATVFARLFVPSPGFDATVPFPGFALFLALVAACHLLAGREAIREIADRLPAPLLGLAEAAVLSLALVLAPEASPPFVYFQF